MAELVFTWFVLLVLCVALVSRRENSGALLLAYFLGLSVIHVPGAVDFLGNASGLYTGAETKIGFELTLAGMAALLLGAYLARATSAGGRVPLSQDPRVDWQRIGTILLTAGVGAYFFVMPLAGLVPSLASVLSAIGSLLIVGVWVFFYDATARSDHRRTLLLLAALPLLPLSTLATGGFLGYGTYWLIAILAFLFVIAPNRRVFYIAAPFAVWLGLSLAVAYFAERSDIREAVWQERAGFGERFSRISEIAKSFELYDINNPSHLHAIDIRLNQNWLVGLAVQRHEEGATEFLHGASVPWWTLVPRAIWPDKPLVGGGGDIVTHATGVPFAAGTSVGAGQPLEFYANFGWVGVIGGFASLGYLLMRLDRRLATAFRKGDVRGVLVIGLPGLALLQPGGNLLEIVVAFVAAMIAARVTWAGLSAFAWRRAARPHVRPSRIVQAR
ncbi:MAG: hypothetical protein WDM85_18675, partial [Caulobacteraceae bacterium]